MPRYAAETTVPVSKSRADIEATLVRYGATEFQSGWKADAAMVTFRIDRLTVRFVLPLPDRSDRRFTHKKDRYGQWKALTKTQSDEAYEQATRQRWRALLLVIKAKLEAVECGISTIEQEFLSFIVMPNGMTIGDFVIDRAMPMIRDGKMPLMLEGKRYMEDAEVTVKENGREAR